LRSTIQDASVQFLELSQEKAATVNAPAGTTRAGGAGRRA
jgi:hypothetical protein